MLCQLARWWRSLATLLLATWSLLVGEGTPDPTYLMILLPYSAAHAPIPGIMVIPIIMVTKPGGESGLSDTVQIVQDRPEKLPAIPLFCYTKISRKREKVFFEL